MNILIMPLYDEGGCNRHWPHCPSISLMSIILYIELQIPSCHKMICEHFPLYIILHQADSRHSKIGVEGLSIESYHMVQSQNMDVLQFKDS